jgi:hypothetical protein
MMAIGTKEVLPWEDGDWPIKREASREDKRARGRRGESPRVDPVF